MILSRRRTDIQAYIQSINFSENKTYDFFLFLYSMVGFQTKTTDQPTYSGRMQPTYKMSATQQTVKKITRENIQAGFLVEQLIKQLLPRAPAG